MSPTWAIVVAGGEGTRLGANLPKAFVRLGGRPLLAHSIDLFEDHPAVDRIVLVVPPDWEEPATLLADELAAGKVAAAVPGGATRALSVSAGLDEVADDAEAILVHDAARPFAPAELIDRLLAALADHDGAIPALAVTDTVKRVGEDGVVAETLDRAELRSVQTPQAFRAAALRGAFSAPPEAVRGATDCASLVEAAGFTVAAVAGDPGNVKITAPDDLARAEARLA
jgi:2-C-methyl-D-erythritol 4-phosphate cytidylyltransferase/2-C-methyl-D-erythritol 2,4-cyclodiphosphate synthase